MGSLGNIGLGPAINRGVPMNPWSGGGGVTQPAPQPVPPEVLKALWSPPSGFKSGAGDINNEMASISEADWDALLDAARGTSTTGTDPWSTMSTSYSVGNPNEAMDFIRNNFPAWWDTDRTRTRKRSQANRLAAASVAAAPLAAAFLAPAAGGAAVTQAPGAAYGAAGVTAAGYGGGTAAGAGLAQGSTLTSLGAVPASTSAGTAMTPTGIIGGVSPIAEVAAGLSAATNPSIGVNAAPELTPIKNPGLLTPEPLPPQIAQPAPVAQPAPMSAPPVSVQQGIPAPMPAPAPVSAPIAQQGLLAPPPVEGFSSFVPEGYTGLGITPANATGAGTGIGLTAPQSGGIIGEAFANSPALAGAVPYQAPASLVNAAPPSAFAPTPWEVVPPQPTYSIQPVEQQIPGPVQQLPEPVPQQGLLTPEPVPQNINLANASQVPDVGLLAPEGQGLGTVGTTGGTVGQGITAANVSVPGLSTTMGGLPTGAAAVGAGTGLTIPASGGAIGGALGETFTASPGLLANTAPVGSITGPLADTIQAGGSKLWDAIKADPGLALTAAGLLTGGVASNNQEQAPIDYGPPPPSPLWGTQGQSSPVANPIARLPGGFGTSNAYRDQLGILAGGGSVTGPGNVFQNQLRALAGGGSASGPLNQGMPTWQGLLNQQGQYNTQRWRGMSPKLMY